MIPVLAIVGRSNVGKSTLFNRLTKSRAALVADQPGLTRDRLYGEFRLDEHIFILVDTGGLGDLTDNVSALMAVQTVQAISEADALLFMVDAKNGLTQIDRELAVKLRTFKKPIFLLVNKTDGLDLEIAKADFYDLGFEKSLAISAEHGQGLRSLFSSIVELFPEPEILNAEAATGVKIAFVGRPNVGKSTLVNRILGEERVVVYDQPGTTRDSIHIPFKRHGENYILIDTAGVRKRARVTEVVEKFSAIKAFQAIEEANVVVIVIDAQKGVAEQDLRLLGFVLQAGKALVIAINKWDGMTQFAKEEAKRELNRQLNFINFAEIHFISALHGTGVGNLFPAINKAYISAMKKLLTPVLTRILADATQKTAPPMAHGRTVKLRYAHAGGHNPPRIIIHGKQTESIPNSYKRYLENFFREALKLVGTPVRIEFKSDVNPYENKKNKLSERQVKRRRRLMHHVKSK